MLQVLVVEEIPAFVAKLNSATEQINNKLTQSAVTDKIIAQILIRMFNISQGIDIPEIKVCAFFIVFSM